MNQVMPVCLALPDLSDRLVVSVFGQDFLDAFYRVQEFADGVVVIQGVDDQGDVFAHIDADIVRSGEKLRCLVYDVGGQNLCEESFLISLVEFLQSAGEQSEGRAHVDVASLTIL